MQQRTDKMPFITEVASFISNDVRDNARRAAAKIRAAFSGQPLRGMIFYAATNYDVSTLVGEMARAFPDIPSFGCTTAGEFSGGRMLKNSVVAMGLGSDVMDMVAAVGVANIDAAADPAARALAALEVGTGLKMRDLDPRAYAGWQLLDGLARHNDRLVERCRELTGVVFAGGCAGDDGHWRKTLVWANGEIFENGAVFALLKPRGRFVAMKTQSARPTACGMIATRVDRERRIIHEFDGRHAAEVYAEAMGATIEPADVGCSGRNPRELYAEIARRLAGGHRGRPADMGPFIERFVGWPLAEIIDGEPFIRGATTVVENGGVQVFMPPSEGVRYTVCRAGNVVDDTRRALRERQRELGGVSAVLMCGCLLREIQVRNDDQVGAFEDLFGELPTVGFSSYGEIYRSVVSQSASMIVFA